MKHTLLFLLLSLASAAFAQLGDLEERRKCYERYDAQGKPIPENQRRYAEWQCGKLAGVVDCNEKLQYDQGRDIIFSGNAGTPFNGRCETCHMNGIIERRVTFVNGKEHGVDTTYYRSGCPQVVRSHIQGVENGQWLFYYDSTQYLAWEMNYQLGQKHGKQIYFRENGDTTKWENYNNGQLHGLKRTYYPNSRIKNEISYENGNFHGPFKVYNAEGILIQEINYKMGNKHEEAMYFYDDGKPLKVEHWDEGIKNGEFKTFYYQGHVQTEEVYKKGIRIGWYIEYYSNSIPKQKIRYDKKGVRVEEHRFDEQGRETYAFGTPEQTATEDDEIPTSKKKRKKKE